MARCAPCRPVIALMQGVNRPHRLRNRSSGLFSSAQIGYAPITLVASSLSFWDLVFLSPRVHSILVSAAPPSLRSLSPLVLCVLSFFSASLLYLSSFLSSLVPFAASYIFPSHSRQRIPRHSPSGGERERSYIVRSIVRCGRGSRAIVGRAFLFLVMNY